MHQTGAYALITYMSQDARKDEESSTERRARILGLSYSDTSGKDKPLFKYLFGPEDIRTSRAVPLRADQHEILFGVTNNTGPQSMQALSSRFIDQRVSFSLISDTGFREYLDLYDPPKAVVYQDITIGNAGSEELLRQVSATLEQVRADDMLAYLVQQAHKLGASDIHIETQRGFVRIRFRMDGVLHAIAKLTIEKHRILLSAIASAGNVSTSSDAAQQGHISQKVTMADKKVVDVNVRLETVPTVNGMDVVMRLFSMNADMYNLDRLGLSEDQRQVVDDIISRPTGLVMAVGPTGSGKTTTLYSMLNTLNTEERKIITIEDPVEYQFPGITQIPVSSKSAHETGFAERLRAVLRLDPDIVMVGEIRDMDTAKTALQASLTGHLVLATFHASSAAAALTRLMDVIGENPLFLSAIRLVMAQRLVRRLDDTTKQPYQPDVATLEQLQRILNTMPSSIPRPKLDGLQLYRPGSSEDNPYGYRGQVALREQFVMTDQVNNILQQEGISASIEKIEHIAVQNGMKTMLHDGVLKVLKGETTLEELNRVIG